MSPSQARSPTKLFPSEFPSPRLPALLWDVRMELNANQCRKLETPVRVATCLRHAVTVSDRGEVVSISQPDPERPTVDVGSRGDAF